MAMDDEKIQNENNIINILCKFVELITKLIFSFPHPSLYHEQRRRGGRKCIHLIAHTQNNPIEGEVVNK